MMLRKKNNISINFSNLKLLIFLIWRLAMIITLCRILLVWYDYICLFFLVGYHRWSYKQFRSDGDVNVDYFQNHILLTESKSITLYKGNKAYFQEKNKLYVMFGERWHQRYTSMWVNILMVWIVVWKYINCGYNKIRLYIFLKEVKYKQK